MSYKLTPLNKTPKKANLIEIALEFEHGDSDLSEKEIFSFNVTGDNLEDFSIFCEKLSNAEAMINQHRCYSSPLNRELLSRDNQISYKGFSVELPRDQIYSYDVVSMSVIGAVYYDENGDRYSFDKA